MREINGGGLREILSKYENAALIAAKEIHALRRMVRIETALLAVLGAVCTALILYIAAGA